MIARSDYAGPITKSAEAMFARAERQARPRTSKTARPPAPRPKSPSQLVLEGLGLSAAILRNWEGAGIVAFPRIGGRRVIDQQGLDCLSAIIALRRAGFTIRQIGWISDTLPPSAAAMRQALRARLAQVQAARDVSISRALVAGRAARTARPKSALDPPARGLSTGM